MLLKGLTMMEVSREILKKYSDINGFNPNYINKSILYELIGMLYYDNVTTENIDNIINDIKENPYNYIEKSSDFNKILNDLDALVSHHDLNRDDYQVLTDAFDRESTYFIHMNKKNDFILVQNKLRCEYCRYKEERKL